MIHECVIDSALNRLSAHFDKRVVVRPPASAADLAQLEAVVGPLPRDLTIYLSTCNGLRVHLDTVPHDQHLCCIHEIERMVRSMSSPAAFAGLIPIRGVPEDASDWLVVQRGPAYGRVIRWSPWSSGAVLLASALGTYLSSWVDYMIAQFDHHGRPRVDRASPDFDTDFIARRDDSLRELLKDESLRAWLQELDLVVPSGADFE
ncbi:MAG: hypothetical protein DCC65_12645 [Planctomycetota bacterium]|nr:MAG: hypothetical protein DCC65_12645 [Planctomycetota bacterium]